MADGEGRLNGAGAERLLHSKLLSNNYMWSDSYIFTSPVGIYGTKGKNGFGLSDMLGNVQEWCFEIYTTSDWQGEKHWGVLRGGSFTCLPGFLRCAQRYLSTPSEASVINGIRVCLAPATRRW